MLLSGIPPRTSDDPRSGGLNIPIPVYPLDAGDIIRGNLVNRFTPVLLKLLRISGWKPDLVDRLISLLVAENAQARDSHEKTT